MGAAAVEEGEDIGLDFTGVREQAAELNVMVNEFKKAIDELSRQNKELGGDTVYEKAKHMRDNVIPAMNAVRAVADRLERVIPYDLWPFPTYREILFVK